MSYRKTITLKNNPLPQSILPHKLQIPASSASTPSRTPPGPLSLPESYPNLAYIPILEYINIAPQEPCQCAQPLWKPTTYTFHWEPYSFYQLDSVHETWVDGKDIIIVVVNNSGIYWEIEYGTSNSKGATETHLEGYSCSGNLTLLTKALSYHTDYVAIAEGLGASVGFTRCASWLESYIYVCVLRSILLVSIYWSMYKIFSVLYTQFMYTHIY